MGTIMVVTSRYLIIHVDQSADTGGARLVANLLANLARSLYIERR